MDLIPNVQSLIGMAAACVGFSVLAFLLAAFFGGLFAWIASWWRSWWVT